jgi:hypothetical protein
MRHLLLGAPPVTAHHSNFPADSSAGGSWRKRRQKMPSPDLKVLPALDDRDPLHRVE